MAQELLTYVTQKVKISALRGNKFNLIVNVKTSAGADYDFTASSSETDNAFFQVFASNGIALQNFYTGLEDTDIVDFNVDVEDGKLTITSTNDNGFWPPPGTYKYSLFTELIDATVSESNLTYWLHGDFVVVDDNPGSSLGGIPAVTSGGLGDGG